MSYSFEYIDIILLAMIAGFIFLRLRGILGKKTGFEGKIPTQFEKEFQKFRTKEKPKNENFDQESQNNFLKGARVAYETIITDFSDSDNKLIESKPPVSYTHLRAHETDSYLVCRLLLEKKKPSLAE